MTFLTGIFLLKFTTAAPIQSLNPCHEGCLTRTDTVVKDDGAH